RGGVAIPGVFEGGATQPAPGSPRQPRWGGAGMHRPSNAARLSPRAAGPCVDRTASGALMTDALAATRYRQLFEWLGDARARELIDKLQVVALTDLDALREIETFLDRGVGAADSGGAPAHPDSGDEPRG